MRLIPVPVLPGSLRSLVLVLAIPSLSCGHALYDLSVPEGFEFSLYADDDLADLYAFLQTL